MSTTGIQNYLSNVFRQVYTYDSDRSITFAPRLEMSNIDTYSGNTISVFTAAVGDSASNVYVGSNAGNTYTPTRGCSNVTAIGYGAGSNICNVTNSVYLGFSAGGGADVANSVIAIGVQAIGGGTSNIAIGNGTGSVGASNILIGHSIAPGNVSNQVRIGYSNSIPIAANLSTKWVGLGGILSPVDLATSTIDISGNTRVIGTAIADGYTSIQGDISVNAVATDIGTLKKGVVLVSAVNKNDTADHAAQMVLAYTTSNTVLLSSNVTVGDASITFSGSNIQITDVTNTTTYDYSITYFPLP